MGNTQQGGGKGGGRGARATHTTGGGDLDLWHGRHTQQGGVRGG